MQVSCGRLQFLRSCALGGEVRVATYGRLGKSQGGDEAFGSCGPRAEPSRAEHQATAAGRVPQSFSHFQKPQRI